MTVSPSRQGQGDSACPGPDLQRKERHGEGQMQGSQAGWGCKQDRSSGQRRKGKWWGTHDGGSGTGRKRP